MSVQMQARSSLTGLLFTWVAEEPDWAAAGFPGTGTALDIAIAATQPVAGGGEGDGPIMPGTTVIGRFPTFGDTTGDELLDEGWTTAQLTRNYSGVVWVDSLKGVSGTRDGSIAKPFATLLQAMQYFIDAVADEAVVLGTIKVASIDTGATIEWPEFPFDATSTYYFKIIGVGVNGTEGRTILGTAGAVDLNGGRLQLTLEDCGWNGTLDVNSSLPAAIFQSRQLNSSCPFNTDDSGNVLTEAFFYYSNAFSCTFGPTYQSGHTAEFIGCKMSNQTFTTNGTTCKVMSPRGLASYTIAWSASNANNKHYVDGAANALAPTTTNGTKVVLT